MQESSRTGLASHPEPRSCGGRREVTADAWIGIGGLGSCPSKSRHRGADAARLQRTATRRGAPARAPLRPRVG